MLAESEIRNVKTSDYKWNHKLWELKAARSINGADKSMQKAIKQIQDDPGGVILDLTQEVDMAILEKQLFSRIQRSKIQTLDVMVLLNGELVKVLRYEK